MICLSPLATHSIIFGLLLAVAAITFLKLRRSSGGNQ